MKEEPYPSLSKTLREKNILEKPENKYPTYPRMLYRIIKQLGLNEKEILDWAKRRYKLKFRTWAVKNGSEIIGSVTSILRPWPKDKTDKDPKRWICQICFLSKEDLFSKFDGQRWACYKLFKRGVRPIIIENKPFKELKPVVKEIIMEKIKGQKSYRKFFELPDSKIDVV